MQVRLVGDKIAYVCVAPILYDGIQSFIWIA